ncbi:MAG: UbiA family prenyltransferase [Planctomycetota bacterium]|jgi:protoheme IX farnesyltransferase
MMESANKQEQSGPLAWLRILIELTKAKITLAVTFSVATGFFLFTERFTWEVLLPALGVFVLACGSAALNQVQEARIDARMARTKTRPIPSGRIPREWALFVSLAFICAGLYILSSIETHTVVLVFLAGLAVFWYNGVYILLKRITAFAVVPGALVGAIPPVIGWSAAGGIADDPAILEIALFFFIWQIPHFWLLLLIYGKDYEEAGLPTLTRIFSSMQIARITSMWIFAIAAMGMVLAIRRDVHVPWNVFMLLTSIWLFFDAFAFLKKGKKKTAYLPMFIRINVYAFLIMIFLMGNSFW